MKRRQGDQVQPEDLSPEDLREAVRDGATVVPRVWYPDPVWVDREVRWAQNMFIALFKQFEARAMKRPILQERATMAALHGAVLAANAELVKSQLVEPTRLFAVQVQADLTRQLLGLHAQATAKLVVPPGTKLQ